MYQTSMKSPVALLLLAGALAGHPAQAQELVPRAYWPAPDGTNILSLGYQNSSGDVVTDPTLPVTGVDASIHLAQVGYQRTFGLLGRTTSVQVALPYSWANLEGTYLGQPASREMTGPGDARLRVSINLRGAPSMDTEEFRALARNPTTLVGASLLIQAPTGQYDKNRLINLGANRWAAKPALGIIHPFGDGRWMLEFELGGWFFSDNDEFLGQTRRQDPILSTEAHLIRFFTRGVWASLDANFYTGGRTRIGGELNADLQRNSRVGATVVLPFRGRHALKGSFSTGAVTESGGDFEMVTIGYVYAW